MGQSRFLLVYFRPFLLTISIIKIVYCVWDSNQNVGADETTEPWRQS